MAKTIEEKIKDYISLTKEYKKGCKYDYETIINLDIYNAKQMFASPLFPAEVLEEKLSIYEAAKSILCSR